MSIRYKLALAINAVLIAALLTFGSIVYNSQKALLQRQYLDSREALLETLVKVTEETMATGDEQFLISYTEGLRHAIPELETAYVSDGTHILAHTDRELSPRQLPLSSGGERVRAFSDKLMVRKPVAPERKAGILYSRDSVSLKGKRYDVVVGYSGTNVSEKIDRALKEVLLNLLKSGLAVILAATLLAFWVSSRMVRPVRELVAAFAATGEGDLTRVMPDTARKDEIGMLNRGFNLMVSRLRELDELKKDFVSSVTHELKSPLGAIESYLDLMEYEVAQAAKRPDSWAARIPRFLENISFVKQNSGRLLRFITDLLDASKIEKGRFEVSRRPGTIEPVVEAAIRLFDERAKRSGVNLKAELPPRLPQVLLDEERITQVLTNLISNALKFTPAGGSVVLKAMNVPDANTSTGGRKGALRVTVADTGGGIPEKELKNLFVKFYQAPGSRGRSPGPKGTGLGLYIVKSIVEAHGGRVFAQSSAGGSMLGFELPLLPGENR
ncbi:MAG: HAMP domain-containing sensor histidine kinase [Elusimicrobiales bacterium]|nr:HAMP domain-containing sensor histidine kinase [Elusimicrobiales bacterium]